MKDAKFSTKSSLKNDLLGTVLCLSNCVIFGISYFDVTNDEFRDRLLVTKSLKIQFKIGSLLSGVMCRHNIVSCLELGAVFVVE